MSTIKKTKDDKRDDNSPQAKLENGILMLVTAMGYIMYFIVSGVICETHTKFSQTNLLPDCATNSPYVNNPQPPKQIPLDFISTSTPNSGDQSIKATYNVEESIKSIHGSFLFSIINRLMTSPGATSTTYYFGSCISTTVLSYYSLHNMFFSAINNMFHPKLIFLLSPLIFLLIHAITGTYAFIQCVFLFYYNISMFYSKKELYDDGDEQKSRWSDGGDVMWSGMNILWTLLIFYVLIIGFIAIIGVSGILSLLVGIVVFTTPFFLNRTYSTTKEITNAIAAAAAAAGKSEQSGGDTPADEDKKDGSGSDDVSGSSSDSDSDSGSGSSSSSDSDSDSDSDTNNNKSTSGNNSKLFPTVTHLVRVVKLYKHIIMFIMTIVVIYDLSINISTYAAMVVLFVAILIAYFTDYFYTPYKIMPSDHFTPSLVGVTPGEKVCAGVRLKVEEGGGKKWYFLYLL